MLAGARRDIEHETRRALDELRREVADLTVTATEKITRKSLTAEDHRRLIEEALSEVDFEELAPSSEGNGQLAHGGDRRGLRPLAVRGREGARRARPRPRRAGRVRRGALRRPHAAGVPVLAVLLVRGEARGREQDRERRGRALRELPRAARRAPPHARAVPHQARVRRALGRGAPAAAGDRDERGRAGRGPRRGHREAHPGADRAQGRAVLERRPRRARGSDGPRREHGPRRDRPQQT